jgi:small subunit ribosomal protein S17
MADENVEQDETQDEAVEAEAEPAEPVAEAEPVVEAEIEPTLAAEAEAATAEEAPAGEEAPAEEAEAPAEAAAEEALVAGAGETPVPEEPPAEPAAEAAAADAAPAAKKKKKRLPRSLRPQRTRPKRETSAERKPITRLPKPEHARGRRQERQGAVVSAAGDKTIVVRVDTVKVHPMYKKVIRRSTKLHAHDERNEAKVGDVVRIVETRPISRLKRWRLQEIVEAAK